MAMDLQNAVTFNTSDGPLCSLLHAIEKGGRRLEIVSITSRARRVSLLTWRKES